MPEPETIPFDGRIFGQGDVNPEETSTASSLLCDTHYAKLGIQGAWDQARVLRLCGIMQVTQYELASLILLSHRQMDNFMERDLFPGTVCLLFTVMENTFGPAVGVLDRIPETGDLIPYKIFTDDGTNKTA